MDIDPAVRAKSVTLEVFLKWRVRAEVELVVPSGALLVRGAVCDAAAAALLACIKTVLETVWGVGIEWVIDCDGPQAANPMDPEPMAAFVPTAFLS